MTDAFDPRLDLVLERTVDARPGLVWRAWTEPEQLMKWFTPAPWRTVECQLDLRPGGIFRTVLEGPDGARNENPACVLEVVPERRLAWTGTLLAGFRPAPAPLHDLVFTAVIRMEPAGSGTRYTATAMHRDEAGARRHDEMGFQEGWGAAFGQMVDLLRTWR